MSDREGADVEVLLMERARVADGTSMDTYRLAQIHLKLRILSCYKLF